MVKDKSTLTNEVVKEQYEELIARGLPFLQIFPEMIQESNVAETFRTRTNERNKSLTHKIYLCADAPKIFKLQQ